MSTRNRVAGTAGTRKRKFFTVQHANKSLVLLRRIVGEITDKYAKLLEVEELIEAAEECHNSEQLGSYRQELVFLVDSVHECLEELDYTGVTIRDLRTGVIEFPAQHAGREIRLCWVYGEDEVSYWHELGAGLDSREEIDVLVAG